jgi:anti-sigma factor RsiW
MTSHPEPRDLLAAYVDGQLDPATQATIDRHLAECAECRADVTEQRRVKAWLAPGAALPAGLAERVRGQTFEAPPAPAPRPPLAFPIRRTWVAAAAIAAVLVVAVLGLGALRVGPWASSPAAAATHLAMEDHAKGETTGSIGAILSNNATQVQATLALSSGLPIALPTDVPAQFHFMGGGMVALDSTHGAHLAWMEDHQMLSLYEAADPGGGPPSGWTEMQTANGTYWMGSDGGYQAVFWRHGGMIFVVTGSMSENTLLGVAQSVGRT